MTAQPDQNPYLEKQVPLMGLMFQRFTLRHWKQSPRQAVLLVLLLAVGIGVYFSVRLANRAAVASFQNFTDLITAQSDWVVAAPSGQIPESTLTELRERLGPRPVTLIPIVETTAAAPPSGDGIPIGSGVTYTLVGIDLVAIRNGARLGQAGAGWLGQNSGASDPVGQFWSAFQNPRGVFVSEAFARRQNAQIGTHLPLIILENRIELEIVGIIPAAAGRPNPPETLLVMDLPALQSLAGKIGKLDRIELLVEPGFNEVQRREDVRGILEEQSQGRWLISSPTDRRAAGATMTRAFRLNLTLLSLIALMVGLYLVFQALEGAVVRRREEIAILRSLGVEESTIRRAWLNEALALGFMGGTAGMLLGWLGAQGAVRLVGRTVNSLYYATSADSAQLTLPEALAALGMALGSSLIAGWWPARDAARTPPAQILVRGGQPPGSQQRLLRVILGVLFTVGALALAFVPPYRVDAGFRIPAAGYAAAFLGVLGIGLATGELVRWTARTSGWLGSRWIPARLALAHLRQGSGRHDLAAASLVWAVAMTAGMAILVSSFDTTMRGWIDRTFQADLYVSSAGAQSASSQNRITPQTWKAVLKHPGVRDANVLQVADLRLPQGPTILVGAEYGFIQRHDALAWISSPPEDYFQPGHHSGKALASESFVERFQKRVGDTISISTPQGNRSLTIAGIFADYGNERGSLMVERMDLAAWYQDELATSIILDLQPSASVETVRAQLLADHPGLQIFTNAHLRTELLRIFRQTFSITHALELIGIVVAVGGLALTLISVLFERRNEMTTLRALGFPPSLIALSTAWEGGMLGAVGSLSGLFVSIGLGGLLVFVINKQAFGWTLRFSVPVGQLAGLAALVTVSAAVAAFAVGKWGTTLPSDHEE